MGNGKNKTVFDSYQCSIQPKSKDADLHIEFLNLNESSAGLILAGGTSSELRKALGPVKVIDNEVWQFYAKLLNQFGVTEDVSHGAGSYIQVGGASVGDQISLTKFKHLQSVLSGSLYPAIDEIDALRKKVVPDNLSYYYQDNYCIPGVGDCRKYNNSTFIPNFWRPLKEIDVSNYASRAKAFNAYILGARKTCAAKDRELCGQVIEVKPPQFLDLMAHVAGEHWPDDFVIINGSRTVQKKQGSDDGSCVPVGADYWSFGYLWREISIDFVLIENISPTPVVISSMIGKLEVNSGLRLPVSQIGTVRLENTVKMSTDAIALTPGERILIPTRITFVAPAWPQDDSSEHRKSVDRLRNLFASSPYKTSKESYADIPRFKDYVYGPELLIGGLIANSTRLGFPERYSVNSIQLTASAEAGSCPYLLAWDEKDSEWVDEGKVLHNAPAENRRYTETRTFGGLRTRFRIEEREPELAHIESAALVVNLDNGDALRLAPKMRGSSVSERIGVELRWGEGIDLYFELPESMSANLVIGSRFEVTGYYERYSSLVSDRSAP
jgi:hypothetical protein